jgi:lysyl-tRNA synthetase class 2
MYEFDPERLAKLAELRAEGVNPYPTGLVVKHTAAEVQALIGDRDQPTLQSDETEVTIAGRVLFKNEMGKAGFARIQDRTGRIQVYVQKSAVGDAAFAAWKKIDLGDHVHVTGRLMRTKTGEPTVAAKTFVLAAKCIQSLPDKHKGISDVEFRYRNRYVDLFMDTESRDVFVKRSHVVRGIRRFFDERDFLEVETPMMQVIPGGAAARPFVTHHNALDIDLYMRIAPELYLKRLVVGGLERVYEINRNFRNEGVSTKHNPEFTMLEFYWAYATWNDLATLTEELIGGLAMELHGTHEIQFGESTLSFRPPFQRIKMVDAVAEYGGVDPTDVGALRSRWLAHRPQDAERKDLPSTLGRWYEWFFDAFVEDQLVQPTFLTHFPTEISPLSRKSDTEAGVAERFELIVAGREIANGFSELNDPVDQSERFLAQAKARESGDHEAMYFDRDYIHALTYGLPPTAGEGIGIDRLVMLLTNRQSIRDVILFPTLRPERQSEEKP